jgi:hypothetical protein
VAEKIKYKLKRRLLITSLITGGIAAFLIWQIVSYFTTVQWQQMLYSLSFVWYIIYFNTYNPFSPSYSYILFDFVFLFCLLGSMIYSIFRTRQVFKIIDQYEEEGGPNSNPIIQFLRMGMFKDAVNKYFEDGRTYESANILYSPVLGNLPILREVWRIVASKSGGKELREEAEKLLEIASHAPKEVQIQIRNMIIEQGVYEIGAPSVPVLQELDFDLEKIVEEEITKCMLCGKVLTENDDQVMCPYCFESACREHLMEHLEKDENCPSCKRPIKEFFEE